MPRSFDDIYQIAPPAGGVGGGGGREAHTCSTDAKESRQDSD